MVWGLQRMQAVSDRMGKKRSARPFTYLQKSYISHQVEYSAAYRKDLLDTRSGLLKMRFTKSALSAFLNSAIVTGLLASLSPRKRIRLVV